LTCPDRELNSDAKDYFTRHMRVLERCSSQWPMPGMIAQIDALREAFSADTTKPFTLKPSFPHPSPRSQQITLLNSSPVHYQPQAPSRTSQESTPHATFRTQPPSPPISTSDVDLKNDSPAVQSLVMLAAGHQQPPASTALPMVDTNLWNPTRIFE